MRRQTKNTIRIVTESLRLVESKELEEGALVSFQVSFELIWVCLFDSLEWLDACIVLPYETLKFSRSISKLGRSLRKDLIGVRLVHVVSHGLASLMGLVSLNKTSGQWVVLFELVVAGSLVIAKNRCDSEIL